MLAVVEILVEEVLFPGHANWIVCAQTAMKR